VSVDAFTTGLGQARAIARGDVSALELVDAYLTRLDAFDAALRSHVTIDRDGARAQARAIDAARRAGEALGPLAGVIVSHKDNLDTAGLRTAAHSRTSWDRVPDADATAVARLRAAGTILLGKTNTTEFACGDQFHHGDTPNPWRSATLYSGASSAGSGSAVAAALTAVATGSDTGGSIRAPAALCGIVGVKPTFGRVSRHGLVPLAWTMDHVGPMTRSVADAAALLAAMAGRDPHDPTTVDAPSVLPPRWPTDLRGVRIGLPDTHFFERLDDDVDAVIRAALATLEGLGAELVPIALPLAGDLAGAGALLSMFEAFALHAPMLQREAEAYGGKARSQIGSGAFYLAADVARAQQIRTAWRAQVDAAFARVDLILTPTLPFAQVTRRDWIESPPDTSWATRAWSLTGHPALTQPCGFTAAGHPVGLQWAARPFHEATLFAAAHAFERATPHHLRRPDERAWRTVDDAAMHGARARVASVSEATLAARRAQATALGLPFDDATLTRIDGVVEATHRALSAAPHVACEVRDPAPRLPHQLHFPWSDPVDPVGFPA
jgi:aspartyl-tRNA(Asn)/glutamyl-tRNA(Gln) amidotransferase subunit A